MSDVAAAMVKSASSLEPPVQRLLIRHRSISHHPGHVPAPWWEAVLRDLGLQATIRPLGGSRVIVAYALAEPGRLKTPLRLAVFGLDALDARLRLQTRRTDADYALGYFIDARKPH